ncbi:type I restriction endonuclease subunit R, EcoR124 family [Verminephrobacter eiseniae]|uniref:type I restriction endonuclease subunit R, EcoR124 family n=1 Tax=Verminephrobacter eiseniae TaxID=364317 RepID=UPI002AA2A51E|nr:hypothetical protein [Verminephrobacter eiseniae]
MSAEHKKSIEALLPESTLRAFKGMYLETAQRLKKKQGSGAASDEVRQLDFEFVLFASAVIDYMSHPGRSYGLL